MHFFLIKDFLFFFYNFSFRNKNQSRKLQGFKKEKNQICVSLNCSSRIRSITLIIVLALRGKLLKVGEEWGWGRWGRGGGGGGEEARWWWGGRGSSPPGTGGHWHYSRRIVILHMDALIGGGLDRLQPFFLNFVSALFCLSGHNR